MEPRVIAALLITLVIGFLIGYLVRDYKSFKASVGSLFININGEGPEELFEIRFEEDPMDLKEGSEAVFKVHRK